MHRLLVLVGVLVVAGSAAGHTAGPCNDAGEPGHSDYAQHHVSALAHAGDLGEVDHDGDGTAHTPGSHQGYSVCDPSG